MNKVGNLPQIQASLNLKEDNFTTYIKSQNHQIVADEPQSIGGNNIGMSPYELLCASLAACTTMTLKMYAERKQWDLKKVKVWVSHEKIKETESLKTIDVFYKTITLIGELSPEQKNRLQLIAGKCPVHKTLAQSSKIETKTLD